MVERSAGIGARSALELLHIVNGKAWEDCAAVFNQITRIGPKSMAKLARNDVKSECGWNKLTQVGTIYWRWMQASSKRFSVVVRRLAGRCSRKPRACLVLQCPLGECLWIKLIQPIVQHRRP